MRIKWSVLFVHTLLVSQATHMCAPAREYIRIRSSVVPMSARARTAAHALNLAPADRAAALLSPRVVVLGNVPRTVLPSDIARLAHNASIDFVRTTQLHPSGSVLVTLADDAAAAEFAHKSNSMCLGGSAISARQISVADGLSLIRAPYAARPSITAALDIIAGHAMRTVLLRGIPPKTMPVKLAKKLERSYALENGELHVPLFGGMRRHERTWSGSAPSVLRVPATSPDSTVAAFLVRLQSTEEAMRLVRAWHRKHYSPQKYGIERTGDRYVVDASVVY